MDWYHGTTAALLTLRDEVALTASEDIRSLIAFAHRVKVRHYLDECWHSGHRYAHIVYFLAVAVDGHGLYAAAALLMLIIAVGGVALQEDV